MRLGAVHEPEGSEQLLASRAEMYKDQWQLERRFSLSSALRPLISPPDLLSAHFVFQSQTTPAQHAMDTLLDSQEFMMPSINAELGSDIPMSHAYEPLGEHNLASNNFVSYTCAPHETLAGTTWPAADEDVCRNETQRGPDRHSEQPQPEQPQPE